MAYYARKRTTYRRKRRVGGGPARFSGKRRRTAFKSTTKRTRRKVTKRSKAKPRRRYGGTTVRRRRVGVGAAAVSHLINPFRRKTSPKIPDGSCTESHARVLRSVKQVEIAPHGQAYICLFPGLNVGAVMYLGDGRNVDNASAAALPDTIFHYGENSWSGIAGDCPSDVGFGSDTTFRIGTNDLAQWRIGSQGLRVTYLNNSHEDDGWFSAHRVVQQNNTDNYLLARADLRLMVAAEAQEKLLCIPQNKLGTDQEEANDPTFITGSLKNIGAYQFKLAKTDNEYSFIHPRHEWNTKGKLVKPATTNKSMINLVAANNQDQKIPYIDFGFDMVVIRVHAGSSTCQLLVEVSSNQEYVYDESSYLSAFMTKSYKSRMISSAIAVQQRLATVAGHL